MTTSDNPMEIAFTLAAEAAAAGEVPVGAVIMRGGKVLATGRNTMRESGDPTAHAEFNAIRGALAADGTGRLADCDLYVTLEPCTMCTAAISFARIRRLYYGADDIKGGAVESGVGFFGDPTCHHAPEVYAGMAARDATTLLQEFFRQRR